MRRTRTLAVALAVAALATVAVVLWSRTMSTPENSGVASESEEVSEPAPIPTSEALIAAALNAGDLTYEESLLARAYALFDDSRLEPPRFAVPSSTGRLSDLFSTKSPPTRRC